MGNSVYLVGYCKARWLCNPQKVPKYPDSAIIRHFFELDSLHLFVLAVSEAHMIPHHVSRRAQLESEVHTLTGVWWGELLGGCLIGE